MNCCNDYNKLLKTDTVHLASSHAIQIGTKQRFEIYGPKGETDFCRVKVDDGVMKGAEEQKCDYLFVRCITKSNKKIHLQHFVELHEGKVTEAYEKLESTVKYFRKQFQLAGNSDEVKLFAVVTNVPSAEKGIQTTINRLLREKIASKVDHSAKKYVHNCEV